MAVKEEKEFSPPSLAEAERLHAPAITNDTKEGEESGLEETFSISEILGLSIFDDSSDIETVCDAKSDYDSDYYDKQLESGLRHMTEDEEADYYRQIEESEGFDIKRLENVAYFDISPVAPLLLETIPSYAEVAKEALESHNQKTGDSLELIKVVKLNQKFYVACACDYYFTLLLRDEDGAKRIYRAKVKSRCPSAKGEILFIKEHTVGDSTFTFDSKASEEKDMISNDNSGAPEGDGYVVRATRKRSFATIAESED